MRQNRTSRTNASIDQVRTAGPSERSRLVSRPVAEVSPNNAAAIAGLGEQLGNFFGRAGQHLQDIYRIKKEEKNEADELIARREAARVKSDFAQYYATLGNEVDAFDAYDQWRGDNYDGHLESEHADKTFEKLMTLSLAELEERRGQSLATANQNRTMQTLKGSIAEVAIEDGYVIEPSAVDQWAKMYENIDPTKAGFGKAEVFSVLMDAMKDTPQGRLELQRYMESPGSGQGNKSFEQSFPEQYAKLQVELAEAETKVFDRKGVAVHSVLDEQLDQPIADIETFFTLETAVDEFGDQYGVATTKYRALKQKLNAAKTKFAEQIVARNNLESWVLGTNIEDRTLDWPDVREQHAQFVREQGGEFLTDDPEARQKAAMYSRYIPSFDDGQRDAFGFALRSGDPTRMRQAIQFAMELGSMSATRNGEVDTALIAKMFNNEADRDLAQSIIDRTQFDTTPLDQIIQQEAEWAQRGPVQRSMAEMLGEDTKEEADEAYNTLFYDALKESTGYDFSGTDGAVDDRILSSVKRRFLRLQGRSGDPDMAEANMTSIMKSVIGDTGYQIVNGQPILTTKPRMPAELTDLPVLGINQTNPLNPGQKGVDTLSQARDDLEVLGEQLGLEASGMSIKAPDMVNGYYPVVTQKGLPEIYMPGQSLPMGEDVVTIPENIEDADAMIKERLGDHWTLVPVTDDFGNQVGFELGYRPRWKTVEESLGYSPARPATADGSVMVQELPDIAEGPETGQEPFLKVGPLDEEALMDSVGLGEDSPARIIGNMVVEGAEAARQPQEPKVKSRTGPTLMPGGSPDTSRPAAPSKRTNKRRY